LSPGPILRRNTRVRDINSGGGVGVHVGFARLGRFLLRRDVRVFPSRTRTAFYPPLHPLQQAPRRERGYYFDTGRDVEPMLLRAGSARWIRKRVGGRHGAGRSGTVGIGVELQITSRTVVGPRSFLLGAFYFECVHRFEQSQPRRRNHVDLRAGHLPRGPRSALTRFDGKTAAGFGEETCTGAS